jgi:hypothetical protein
MRKFLLITLFSLTMPLVSIESIIRVFDPFGVYTHAVDIDHLQSSVLADDELGYILPPGQWNFRYWSATMTNDGRYTPATHESSCDIAFLGDSVTFGFGVNDQDTFVNQLAQQFPDVQFHNYGLVGYNAAQVAASQSIMPPADGYIYMLINNDADTVLPWPVPPRSFRLDMGIQDYWWDWNKRTFSQPEQVIPDWFWDSLNQLTAIPHLRIVGFPDNTLTDRVAERYAITFLDWSQHRISRNDAHPNAFGHRELAVQLIPIVANLITEACSR